MANLIEFSNIVQEFDNNIVLKGVNLQNRRERIRYIVRT